MTDVVALLGRGALLKAPFKNSISSAWRSASICKRAMPSWQGALTMEQIEDLWVYVSTHAYQQ